MVGYLRHVVFCVCLFAATYGSFTVIKTVEHNYTNVLHINSIDVGDDYLVLFYFPNSSLTYTLQTTLYSGSSLEKTSFDGSSYRQNMKKDVQVGKDGNTPVLQSSNYFVEIFISSPESNGLRRISPFNPTNRLMCGSSEFNSTELKAFISISKQRLNAFSTSNGLKASICNSNPETQNLMVCNVDNVILTQATDVKLSIDDVTIHLFAVMARGSQKAICTFTLNFPDIRRSPDKEFIYSYSQQNEAKDPIAIAVSKSGGDFFAYVLHTDGLINQFYVGNDGIHKIDSYALQVTTPPFPFMSLSNDKLLVTDKKSLILVDVEEVCQNHQDLCACRKPKNPICGWCVSTNRCTEIVECSGIWLQALASEFKCYETTYRPLSVSRKSPQPFFIDIDEKLSTASDRYQCIYRNNTISTKATISITGGSQITCAAPDTGAIDRGFQESGTLVIPVTIYAVIDKTYLPVVANYTMVVCSHYSSCSECVASHSSCTWCKNDFKCTDNANSDCPTSPDSSARTEFGGSTCPIITSNELKIPINVTYSLSFTINHFPSKDLVYYCRTKDSLSGSTARKSGNNITCPPSRYQTLTNVQNFTLESIDVDVMTGENIVVASTKATLYSCGYHGVCTQCLQPSNFTTGCVWCQQFSVCSYQKCPETDIPKSKCPTLDIKPEEVTPKYVPIEGGIVLTIKGRGLIIGDSLKTAIIQLNQSNCIDIAQRPSLAEDIITCKLPKLNSGGTVKLKVSIKGIVWEMPDTHSITYYNPQITAMEPLYGPLAGGTILTLKGLGKEMTHIEWSVNFVKDNYEYQLKDCKIVDDKAQCKTYKNSETGKYGIVLRFTENNYTRNPNVQFEYRPDSTISNIFPNHTLAWGGTTFTVQGTHLNSVSNPKVMFSNNVTVDCDNVRDNSMSCIYPAFNTVGTKDIVILMDGINRSLTTKNITVLPNPVFDSFKEYSKPYSSEIVLTGNNISSVKATQIKILIGEAPCQISQQITDTLVVCKPPEEQQSNPNVTVWIDETPRFYIGMLTYGEMMPPQAGLGPGAIGGIAAAAVVALILVIVALLLYRRSRYHKLRYLNMVKHVDQLESNSRHEIKQAFAELQTDMSDLMSDLNVSGAPFWDYKNYTFRILFPGQTDHPSLHKLLTKKRTAIMQALDKFEHLVYNKDFLMIFIRTLEEQPSFTMQDKVQLASLLMLALQHKMEYATHVILDLLSQLIEGSVKKKHPKLLLRRSESVVEKMLTHWLSLCLYKYLQSQAGTPLFMLYKAIKHQIDKGPVDALTGEARYSLSQDRLLRHTIDTQTLTLFVGLESGEEIQVKVNDCDTPTQVKEKILDSYYKNQAYSMRPVATDYNLEWYPGMVGVPLCDEDLTSSTSNGWKKLNTLGHYSIPDQARMKLVPQYKGHSLQSDRSRDTDKFFDTLSTNKGTPLNTLKKNASSSSNLQDHYVHSHITPWHLVKNHAQTLPKDRQQTMISEIFLTRLLKTKGTLQEFIDKLFQTIFSTENIPPTIKYLFDFLDKEAQRHGITDPEVVHIWKNNSLNLRFWVNIIKNPEFVFDIYKSEIVDSSLSAIAQTFIDSCAMSESDYGADAPVNKLLFAKDRPKYRKMLQAMYNDIRNRPQISDQTLNAHLSELSKMYPKEIHRNSALKEVYQYAQKYQEQIIYDLDENFPKHRNPNLSSLFRSINSTLDDDTYTVTEYV